MGAAPQKRGAAKVRHLGRNKAKIARYYAAVYPPRKIRRMLHSNGVNFARAWAMKYGALAEFNSVSRKMGIEV